MKPLSYNVADDKIDPVLWLNDVVGQFHRATKPCPQKLVNKVDPYRWTLVFMRHLMQFWASVDFALFLFDCN